MRQRIVGIAILLLGTSLLLAFFQDKLPAGWPAAIGLTVGLVLAAFGLLTIRASFSPKNTGLLRLDWYLPFLRRRRKNEIIVRPLMLRIASAILPRSWFANRETGKPGRIRKTLKRIGPTMLSSPFRRVVQAVCLAVFLILFFYVCWPYHARPAPPGRSSVGWTFTEIDQASGALLFHAETESDWQPVGDAKLYLVESAEHAIGTDDKYGMIIPCKVSLLDGKKIELLADEELTLEQFDRLFTATGTWTLFEKDPTAWPAHYTDSLRQKEKIPAETFLVIDPLVSLSTAIASRSWVWSLACAGIILIVCVLIPRGFCGYLCPLGTTIDLFDWLVAGRVKRFRVPDDGWWVHVKYYLLSAILVAAICGVLISGFFAAIPVLTRGLLFIGEPLQTGLQRDWHQVAPLHVGHWLSILLFAAVLCLGFLRPRFWCKYVCPSGAVFSIGNLFRVTERKVESTCINCNRCVEICPFDAIKPDFTTRVTDCTLCQTCAGVCPTHAIKFVERWNLYDLKTENDPPTGETAIGRRGFFSLAVGSTAAIAGGIGVAITTKAFGANLVSSDAALPVRPPGSVPEQEFLEMCIRCGECFKACPNNVLQAEGFQQGLEGLWAPLVNADWAGCESSCNACGQVCPTGAIRALPLAEKKVARMGLAIVNTQTCLPFADREACQLCVDECNAAGYRAIEFTQVHTELDETGNPLPDSGFLAPVVLADKCVGCGLCQTRCHAINVKEKHLLDRSAIIVEAGAGKEDRLLTGSYIELRQAEAKFRKSAEPDRLDNESFLIPNTEPFEIQPSEPDDDPFGLGLESGED